MAEAQSRADGQPADGFTQVEFSGQGREYFNIWQVNLLLSLVTLGIYSAWAKVRTSRYFYGHTLVAGHPMRYLANPVRILIGRVVGLAFFGGYSAIALLSPTIGLIASLAFLLVFPYLAVLSLRFIMRVTAWHNICLNFVGGYGRAFLVMSAYMLLGLVTLGLAMPWALKQQNEYIYGNIRYGDRQLQCRLDASRYYLACGAGLLAVAMLWLGFLLLGGGELLVAVQNPDASGDTPPLPSPPLIMLSIVSYLLLVSCYGAIVRNHICSRVHLPGLIKLESTVKIWPLFWLMLTNLLLAVVSLGMALPWTQVRVARFYAKATRVRVNDSIDQVIARMPKEVTAVGDEVADAMGMDVGAV